MMLMISDDSKFPVGLALKATIEKTGSNLQYFSADRMSIAPCTACGSCSSKTYGRCVLDDDMQTLYPHIVACKTLVFISPVVFGGPGYHIKKVIDRMSAVGDPRYRVRKGELVKGMGGKGFVYHMVGVGDGLAQEEQAAFGYFHQENCTIMNTRGKAFLLPNNPRCSELAQVLEGLIDG